MKRINDKNLLNRLDEISVLKKVKDELSQHEDDPTQTLVRSIHYELLIEPKLKQPIILIIEQRTFACENFSQFLFWYTEEEYKYFFAKRRRPKFLEFEEILEVASTSPKVQSELLFHLDLFG